MSVTFYFPDYQNPQLEMNVSNANACHLFRIAELSYSDDLCGKMSPDELHSMVYNLEQFILDHRNSSHLWRFTRYLMILSRMHGFAVGSGLSIAYC